MSLDKLDKYFRRAIAPLKRNVQLMLSRGIVARVDDSSGIKRFQGKILAGETLEDIEVFQEFGFSSRPPRGSEFVLASIGGNREHAIAIATMNRNLRIKNLKDGETVIFDKDGNYVYLKENGNIEVKASTKVLVDAPESEFTGNVLIKGNLTVEGNTTVQGTSTLQGAVTAESSLDVQGATTTVGITASGAVAGAGITDTVIGVSMAQFRTTFNSHTHNENGDGGGITNSPNQTL